MKLTVMTIIISLSSCIQVARTIVSMRSGVRSLRSSLAWIALWTAIGVGSLYPTTIDSVVRAVQMEDRMYFIFLLSVLILFIIVFDLASRLERNRRDLLKIVQEIAILRHVAGADVPRTRLENPDKDPDA